MANIQKVFLRRVKEIWKTEFPFLKSVQLNEMPKLPKDCNFRCDDFFSTRGVVYFVTFDFSPRRQGEFSLGITVSHSPDKSILSPPIDSQPSPTNIGSHNIASFLERPAFRWDLVDVDARTNAILVSLGGQAIATPSHVAANTWRPSSYSLSFGQIADEAIRDVNDKLRRFVFPKLNIIGGN